MLEHGQKGGHTVRLVDIGQFVRVVEAEGAAVVDRAVVALFQIRVDVVLLLILKKRAEKEREIEKCLCVRKIGWVNVGKAIKKIFRVWN